MRKNFYLPVFAAVGATALFVGLAGSARAIPDSMRSWIPSNEQSDYDAVRSISRSDNVQGPRESSFSVVQAQRESSFSVVQAPPRESIFSVVQVPRESISSVVFAADLKENMGKPHDFGSRFFHRDNPGVPGGPSASVPDGGTTVMLMGGALCGLFFMAKKLKF